jgi:hypothetical protein
MAASVTGWARTILHKKIRQTNAAYCDTDSVIYPDKWDDEGAGIELEDGVKVPCSWHLRPNAVAWCSTSPTRQSKSI